MTTTERPETDGGVATVSESATVASGSDTAGIGRQTLAIARLEYRLSFRRRWALALTALFAFLSVLVAGFGGSALGPVRVDAVVVSLASLATYLVPLASLVYGFDAVVGSDETGWLEMVFALPVTRSRVVVGTFLGRAATLAGAVTLGFGVGGVSLWIRAGTVAWDLYATVLLGAVCLSLAFLAVGVLVSTVAAEKTHALGIALLAWVWLVFGHDLAALGLVTAFDLPDAVLSGLVLANPIDVFRVVVLSGVGAAGSGMAAVVAETDLTIPLLAVGALAWVVAPVGVAARLIRRRSL